MRYIEGVNRKRKIAFPEGEKNKLADRDTILLICLSCYRITSSRKIEAEAGRNIELMWLIRKLKSNYWKSLKSLVKSLGRFV